MLASHAGTAPVKALPDSSRWHKFVSLAQAAGSWPFSWFPARTLQWQQQQQQQQQQQHHIMSASLIFEGLLGLRN
jgi:hypothetical protein